MPDAIKSIEELCSFIAAAESDQQKRTYPPGTEVVLEGEFCNLIAAAYAEKGKLDGELVLWGGAAAAAGAGMIIATGAVFAPLALVGVLLYMGITFTKPMSKATEIRTLPLMSEVRKLSGLGFSLVQNHVDYLKLRRS
jgi:hypothetical protein